MLILLTGAFSQEIKANSGEPLYPRMERTDTEIVKILKKDSVLCEVYASNINSAIAEQKIAYNKTIRWNNIGWILNNHNKWVSGSELKSKYNIHYVYNGNRNKKTKLIDMSSYERVDDGEIYGVFDCEGAGFVVWIKQRCLNPQKQAKPETSISEKPEEKVAENDENVVYTDRVSDQTTSNSDCYVWVDVPQYGQATQAYYAGIGENTGYLGNRTTSTSQTVFLGYRKEKVPCSVYEDYRQMSEPQQKTWCERNPVWCTILLNTRINVGVQVSGNNNNGYYYGGGNTAGGTYTPNGGPGGPTPTGGPGGPTPTGGNGGPGGPKPRGR